MERVAVFLLAAVPVISLVAVVLLCCGSFTAQRALVIGIPLALWLARPLLSKSDVESNSNTESRWPARARAWLVLVLLIGALLRWPPALYLQSMQDPGVYTAMAGYFVENGTLDVTDDIRDSLASPDAIARFDANNAGDTYQPGAYVDPKTPGHYVFQFYHVHPLWMAIFGGIFGLDHSSWSQIFFGLLSLFFAALIAESLSRDWKVGIAFASVLAVLPLHVFFSKFPISEMPMLAFAFMAVHALLRASDDDNEPTQRRWLFFAALAFAATFLTRISGFVYLPVVYASALVCHVFIEDPQRRKRWVIFWLTVFACYFGSVIYGLVWSFPYSRDIYLMHFGPVLLPWVPWLLVVGALIGAVPFLISRSDVERGRLRGWLLRLWFHAQRWSPLLFVVFLLIAAGRVAVLAFTDYYKGNAWYDLTWNMSHAGSPALLRSAILVAAENMGPALPLLLPFALWKSGDSPRRALLTLIVLVMIGYSAALQWFLPYQYYYARYLLSELVPFTLLLVVIRCADWWHVGTLRRWITIATAITGIYFAWFTWPLIGFREAEGAESSLTRIASQVDQGSVLLVDETSINFAARFVTPLRMWFGLNVYTVRDFGQLPAVVRDLRRVGVQDIVLLRGTGDVPAGFAYDMRIHFEQTRMERTAYLPRASEADVADFVLSRLDDSALAATLLTGPGLELSDLPSGCCSGFDPDGVWTKRHAALRGLALPKGSWQRLVITMHGYRPDYTQAGLVVHANGKELRLEKADGPTFEFSLGPIEGPTPLELELDTRTFVPRELGLNDDPRHLGLDIGTLHID
jgi:hypothetical protein